MTEIKHDNNSRSMNFNRDTADDQFRTSFEFSTAFINGDAQRPMEEMIRMCEEIRRSGLPVIRI